MGAVYAYSKKEAQIFSLENEENGCLEVEPGRVVEAKAKLWKKRWQGRQDCMDELKK